MTERKLAQKITAAAFVAATIATGACQAVKSKQRIESAIISGKPSFPEPQDIPQTSSQERLSAVSQQILDLENTTRKFINPKFGEISFLHLYIADLINSLDKTARTRTIRDIALVDLGKYKNPNVFAIQMTINEETHLQMTHITADLFRGNDITTTYAQVPSRLKTFITTTRHGNIIINGRLKSAARSIFNLPEELNLKWSTKAEIHDGGNFSAIHAEGSLPDGRYLHLSLDNFGNANLDVLESIK
ncbi:MAG: hypothetical protein Q8P89_00070 [bacterium]|nr:hypothetical protein [bacterium]